jgi:hypothetical protein
MTVQALRPLYQLETRLQDIRTANGYHTDAGVRVYLGRTFLDAGDVPALTIRPGEDEGEVEVDASLYRETVAYEIHGVCSADPAKPFEAGHQLAADIRRAIYRARSIDFEDLDGTAAQVEPGGTVVTEAAAGGEYCEVTVALRVTHTEQLGAPDQPE